MPVLASVYFVDVAQGTSQVILFPDSSIVIIDCGQSANALLSLLESIAFDRIRAIVLSHWHKDHIQGAPAIIRAYEGQIDRIYFAQDRAAEGVLRNEVFQKINEKSDNRKAFGIDKLLFDGVRLGRLWPVQKPVGDEVSIAVIYPDAVEEMQAQDQNDPNQGSGMLILKGGISKILFPGDAGKKAFEAVASRLGDGQRLRFDLVAAPHHSGKLCKGNDSYAGFDNCFEWLYSTVLQTDRLIVSAGTDNSYTHPREDHLRAAVRHGATVMCTQITDQCHPAPDTLGISVLNNCHENSSCCLTGLQRKGTGCAGTIQVDVHADRIVIVRLDEHQQAIDSKLDAEVALCRKLSKEILA